MKLKQRLLTLSIPSCLWISSVVADEAAPTAIKKLSPDPNEKLLAEHLAFAPPFDLSSIDRFFPANDSTADDDLSESSYRPAFGLHYTEAESRVTQRAARALALLQRRSSCPSDMQSCANIGSPAKCCEAGTVCTWVSDSTVGNVACCPEGSTCGGSVGDCPSSAVSCPSDLGGGCCIAGYICQGDGCVPSGAATITAQGQPTQTMTTTRTTLVGGNPSTVVVTIVVTQTSSDKHVTRTTVETVHPPSSTGTGSATGGAPYRPISSSTSTSTTTTTTAPVTSGGGDSQTGCPTGYYGCLATHGGGCCRTDRNCQTYSCPPLTPSTVVSDGRTIVVEATGTAAAPANSATSTCAGGWFMCGSNAGPVAGCCPSGYSCGTASCFSVQASQTESRAKELPKESAASGTMLRCSRQGVIGFVVAVFITLFTMS